MGALCEILTVGKDKESEYARKRRRKHKITNGKISK
jgi:hypothetical protein